MERKNAPVKNALPATVHGELSNFVRKGAPIAAFDFDSTLRAHRGKGPDEEMTARFIALLARQFNVVIFSNRRSDGDADPLREYVNQVCNFASETTELKASGAVAGPGQSFLPVSVLGSCAHDRFRKPHRGMWELYVAHLEKRGYDTACPGFRGSYFCGDAAGRPGDFAATDLTFARNCGLRFVLPEVIFGAPALEKEPTRSIGGSCAWDALVEEWKANPDAGYSNVTLQFLSSSGSAPDQEGESVELIKGALQGGRILILMTGGQASGKTTLAVGIASRFANVLPTNYLSPENKSPASHWKAFEKAIRQEGKQCIVVDGTHPTVQSRAQFIAPARAQKFKVAIVHMQTPKEICQHMNSARCELDKTNATKEIVDVAIHTYWKRCELVSLDEADSIIRLHMQLRDDAPKEVTEFRYG